MNLSMVLVFLAVTIYGLKVSDNLIALAGAVGMLVSTLHWIHRSRKEKNMQIPEYLLSGLGR